MNNRAREFVADTVIALAQIVTLCTSFAGLAAVIAVILWHEAGAQWVEAYMYWPALYATVVALAATVICLLLSAIRPVRPIASVVACLCSYVIGYSLWVWMLLVAAALAGT